VDEQFDIGYLGGGQLARMSIMAAQRTGLKCISLDPGEETPASQIAPAIQAPLDDPEAVARLISVSRRITLENEFIPAAVIVAAFEQAGRGLDALIPGVESLAIIQDKLTQRKALLKAGVPSPDAVEIAGDGSMAIAKIGFPMVLKARFGGYDGKGTRYAKNAEEFENHRGLWEKGGWMAEQFVPFQRELAVMVCRDERGTMCFPTMETVQVNHVCDTVFPSDADASKVAIAAIEAVGGHGLFGVELFQNEDHSIVVNEIAPRPHNSGHYSMDWGGISQFDAHVRLVLGLPMEPPAGFPTCMVNLLGQEGAHEFQDGLRAACEDPMVRVHWYGKAESRPGRKMGHINVSGDHIVERAQAARERFYRAWTQTTSVPQEVG